MKIEEKKTISIGIPVKNEIENIPYLIPVLKDLILQLEEKGFNVEVILNDNASSDGSTHALRAWANTDTHIKLFEYQAGVSFQASILEMMKQSTGDAFVVFQSDLQDPPEMVLRFVQEWSESGQIIAGVIKKRIENRLSRITRHLFYFTLRAFSDGQFFIGFQDFYLLPKYVYKNLSTLSQEGLFLRGHISSRYSEVKTISYVRRDRVRGSSNFNFARKYGLAIDGLLLFGTRFIRFVSTISLGIFLLGTLMIFLLVGSFFLGFRAPVPGWTSVGVALLMLLSLIGMTTSLILEYLVRIYRFLVLGKAELRPIEFRET